jgi:hypothetical protein
MWKRTSRVQFFKKIKNIASALKFTAVTTKDFQRWGYQQELLKSPANEELTGATTASEK